MLLEDLYYYDDTKTVRNLFCEKLQMKCPIVTKKIV